jgi:pyruvate/2-oxoglutarate dehydrogenase complex dihydrolipoamide acyltransferase (E2) component
VHQALRGSRRRLRVGLPAGAIVLSALLSAAVTIPVGQERAAFAQTGAPVSAPATSGSPPPATSGVMPAGEAPRPPLPPSAAVAPTAAEPPVVLLVPPPKPAPSVTDQWWFWTAVAGVVVVTATVLLVSTRGSDAPSTKLGNMEAFK